MPRKRTALLGRIWEPREIALLLTKAGWVNVFNLAKMVATVLAESLGYEHAFHWNDPAEGGDGSVDWGLFEMNDGNKGGKAPSKDGTPQPGGIKSVEQVLAFRDRAWTPELAAQDAYDLYDRRGFQPWAAVANGQFKRQLPRADYGVMNMLRVYQGFSAV